MQSRSSATAPTVPLASQATPSSTRGTHGPGAGQAAHITGAPSPHAQGCPFLALIMPSDEGERQAQAMENWFQACSSDEPFALELVGTRREQGFLLRASSEAQLTLLCKQLEAQYPQAQIHRLAPQADPLLLHRGEHAVIGEFSLAQPSYLPLKTFSGKALAEPGADPLAGLLATMETIGSGQRIVAQLALVRAPETWLSADLRKTVEHALQPERDQLAASMRSGASGSDLAEGGKLVALLVAGLGGMLAYRWYQAHAILPLALLGIVFAVGLLAFLCWKLFQKKPPLYDMKLVAEKMARAGFYCQLRVIVIGREATASKEHLQRNLSMMEVAYRQFTLASSNHLYLKRSRYLQAEDTHVRRLTNVKPAFPYANLLLRLLHNGAYSWQVLNALELSGMFHLPQESADLPLVRRVSFKGLLASPELARQMKLLSAPLPPALMGYSRHRRYRVPVYLPFDALFSHKFFVGMSRSGKSVLIQLLTQAAMQPVQRRSGMNTPQPGVFVADPHRDLVMDLLKLVPPERAQDVLLLDMTESDFPVGINPLDASMGWTRDQAVSNLMSCFQKIWAEQWGPRMAYFLNSVCLLLYTLNERLVQAGRAEEQYTLLDINPLLQQRDYAIEVLSQLDMSETWHQELMVFWQTTYLTLNPAFKNEVIMPIISKMGVFNDNQQLRRIVGQPVTRAPVHEAITAGKIVLCALSARDMDDSAVNILGSTLINLLHRAFSLQQTTPLAQRRKVFVAVDEFQNFSGGDFDKLLSEDAKYGCALLLATQNLKRLNQIREGFLEMVLSNCQQLCVFRISAADAKLMEEELQKKVTVKHILSQPALHCYARLAVAGYPLQIVSVQLTQPASWQDDPARTAIVEEIRCTSQGGNLPVAEVDRRHAEHLRKFLDINAYTSRLQREVRAARARKQDQAAAEQLAQELQAAQVIKGTKQPTGPLPDAQPSDGKPKGTTEAQQQEQGKSSSAPAGPAKMKQTRNHRRSRRVGKKPVGVPPPDPTAEQADHPVQDDADEELRPHPGSGGAFLAGGNSWGTAWGYEGREGRERA
jgi:hypothetical protein